MKIDLVLENIRIKYTMGLLEESDGMDERSVLAGKMLINESTMAIRKMLVEEGTMEAVKSILEENWTAALIQEFDVDNIGGALQGAINSSTAQDLMNKAAPVVSNAVEAATPVVQNAVEAANDAVNPSLYDQGVQAVQGAYNQAAPAVQNAYNQAGQVVDQGVQAVRGAATDAYNTGHQAGVATRDALQDPTNAALAGAGAGAVTGVAGAAVANRLRAGMNPKYVR